MRWFWQRRKRDEQSTDTPPDATAIDAPSPRAPRVTAPRSPARSTPLPLVPEPRDALLMFARDALNAQGARVRIEEDDLIIATFADAAPGAYTTTLARARSQENVTLLTQGAPALEALFDVAERRARFSMAILIANEDPATLALAVASRASVACGRCAGGARAPWADEYATCDDCPIRIGSLALRWASPPTSARVVRWDDETSVEFTYRISGRDRRGRRDEWLRLAFNPRTGERLEPLPIERLTAAQAPESASGDGAQAVVSAASAMAQAALRPEIEALGLYLAQRVSAEYQQRIEDLTTTHDRLKRERPGDATVIEASLARELASLAEVYGIEVEASLEGVCVITSPIALVALQTKQGEGPLITVDVGRRAVRAPACARCGAPAVFGRVCDHGHVYCANCVEVCARCDVMRCPVCGDAQLTVCGLCREPTCRNCAQVCDDCGKSFCADHVWTCAGGDHVRCLRDLILCAECQTPLCETHAATCAGCGQRLCARHTRVCATGGEALCAAHASHCASCQRPLCEAHTMRCEECDEPVCAADIQTCAGCGRALGPCASLTPCATCGAAYCARCHDGASACPACRALAPATEADLALLRLAAAREPAISLKRAWQTGQNARARVYVSRGIGREEVYLIADDGAVLSVHRKGWRAR